MMTLIQQTINSRVAKSLLSLSKRHSKALSNRIEWFVIHNFSDESHHGEKKASKQSHGLLSAHKAIKETLHIMEKAKINISSHTRRQVWGKNAQPIPLDCNKKKHTSGSLSRCGNKEYLPISQQRQKIARQTKNWIKIMTRRKLYSLRNFVFFETFLIRIKNELREARKRIWRFLVIWIRRGFWKWKYGEEDHVSR